MELSDRFWSKVARSGEDDCWLWTAKARQGFGYGVLNVGGGKTMTSHRLAFLLTHGEIPEGAHILHTCDVPGCCNPKHLYAGTDAQNKADMMARCRQRKGGHSEETRAKISAARKGKPTNRSPEGLERVRAAMRRRWQSPEWRAQFSERMSGSNNHQFGKPPSEERMAAVLRANQARRGQYHHTEETKQKMRASALARQARQVGNEHPR